MTRIVPIPFALGQDESYSPVELPAGPLLEAVNVRQRQLHSFGVRSEYIAQTMSEMTGTAFFPLDLYDVNGRLVALAAADSTSGPTLCVGFVQQPGASWKFLSGSVTPVTDVRNVCSPPEASVSVEVARVGAVDGIVCVTYGAGNSTPGATTYYQIARAGTDDVIARGALSITNARVVVANKSFWIIGVNSASDLVGFRFDTSSATALAGSTNLYVGTVTNCVYDAVSVKGASQFAIVVRDAATTVIRRFNESGVQQVSFAGPAVAADTLTMDASATSGRIIVAYRVGAADAFSQTFNSTTGASVVAATAMFGQVVSGQLYLQRITNSPGGFNMFLVSEDADRTVRLCNYNENNYATRINQNLFDYTLAGRPMSTSRFVLAPVNSGSGDNELVYLFDSTPSGGWRVAAAVDDDIAFTGDPVLPNQSGGDTCTDPTTGKGYWARIAEGNSGSDGVIVAELTIDSLARRQSCQVGNALLLAGGAPSHLDGKIVGDSGFPGRPSFAASSSFASSAAAGGLLPGAEYDYIAVYAYQDSQGNVQRSRLSDALTGTLGASDNTVTIRVHAPHSNIRDFDSGSAPVIELYRTHADRETTTALIASSRDFSLTPAVDGDFNLQTLQISVDGGATQTVTFGATDNTVADIVSAINTQTTGCTAFADGGVVSIETDTEGAGGSIAIIGGTTTGTGASSLGFFVTQNATGTSTYVKSTVFQRCAVQLTTPSDEFGAIYSIVDTMSDATLLTQRPLYTNAERGALSGILEHEPPPPFKFCTTVGKRAFIGGLPDRSEVRISKELFPGETLAFSADSAFRARIEGDCTGVATLAGIPVAFTADGIYVFPTSFPNDNGDAGALGPGQRLDTEEGCTNSDSIAATAVGVFYQSRTGPSNVGKLMLLRPGASGAEWIGRRVHGTLALFPVITSATYVDKDNCVLFTCQNTGGSASIILVFDLSIEQWMTDTFTAAQVIRASTCHSGLLAYLDSSTLRIQSTSLVPSSFISYRVTTGDINPFGGGAEGRMPSVTVPVIFRGNARIQMSVSYDSGKTYNGCKVFELTTAGGDTVDSVKELGWWPSRQKGSKFRLRWDVTADSLNTASEGLILPRYSLELEGARPSRIRLPTAQKG